MYCIWLEHIYIPLVACVSIPTYTPTVDGEVALLVLVNDPAAPDILPLAVSSVDDEIPLPLIVPLVVAMFPAAMIVACVFRLPFDDIPTC